MTEAESTRPALPALPVLRTLAVAAAILALAACGPGRAPEAAPRPPAAERVEPAPPPAPPTPPSAPSAPESGAGEAAEPAPAPDAEAAADDLTVVIDAGGPGADETRDLVGAARQERERRRDAGRPTAVITDESLPTYATGELTVANPTPQAAAGESPEEAEARLAELSEREAYWRRRVLDIRRRWREAYDRIAELEAEAADLRRRFYAEDDPYYRDTQIKPAWDRALENLETARETIARSRDELERTVEEGRQAGALPGWLREGFELEPEDEPLDEEGSDPLIHEAADPTIVEPGDDGGGGR